MNQWIGIIGMVMGGIIVWGLIFYAIIGFYDSAYIILGG